MENKYTYIMRNVPIDKMGVNWVVEFPDFPGITGGGLTQEEALEIANEALEMYIEVLDMEGKTIQQGKESISNGRVTLRIAKSLHARIVQLAEREGVSLNSYICDAIAQKVYSNEINSIFKQSYKVHNFDDLYISLSQMWRDEEKIISSKSNFEEKTTLVINKSIGEQKYVFGN